MRPLRLVGPGEDGTLILETPDGAEQFALPVDDALRTAIRPTPPEPDPTGKETAIDLRPRDIQMRVRSGEDPQDIADEAGTTVERVMRFAYPVLQERIRVVDEARRARARRGSDGQLVPFGELVDTRFAVNGIEPTAIAWNAFRRPDGGWSVTAEFTVDDKPLLARFSFALVNRTVSALDDIAADLLSERPIQALIPPPLPPKLQLEPAATPSEDGLEGYAGSLRLAAVPDRDDEDDEAVEPNAASAIRLPTRRQKAHTHPLPIALDDELFDQEALDPLGDTGWHEPPLPLDLGDADPDAGADSAPLGQHAADEDRPGAHHKRGRASDKPRMPSWDDILLGVRRKTE
jgi:hypothetical protein